jgi:hypothetical protein
MRKAANGVCTSASPFRRETRKRKAAFGDGGRFFNEMNELVEFQVRLTII